MATHTPTRDEAWDLVTSMTQSEQLRRHMRSVEAAMRVYARKFGEDEERWAVLGLIHDWDYETGPTMDLHPMRGIQMLREKGWPEDILDDVASHADYLTVPRDTNIRKALNAVDEMCGFIIACALVKPDKSLGSVEPSTVRKKMKEGQGLRARRASRGADLRRRDARHTLRRARGERAGCAEADRP